MWKWTSCGLLVALLISNGWWIYRSVDQSITRKYEVAEKYVQEQRVKSLLALTNNLIREYSKEKLLLLLTTSIPDSEPFEKEGHIHIHFLSFRLGEDGMVTGVRAN